jgi:GWxTD domain-containing protein
MKACTGRLNPRSFASLFIVSCLSFIAQLNTGYAANSRLFDFHAMYQRSSLGNVVVQLSLSPQLSHVAKDDGTLRTEVEINIDVREVISRRVVASRTFREHISPETFTGADPYSFAYNMTLPPGEFIFCAEVKDRITGRLHYAEQITECDSYDSPYSFSGISFWQMRQGDANAFAVFGAPLNPLFKGDWLRFSCEAYVPRGQALTARALLYKRESAGPSSRDDLAYLRVQRYSSIDQYTTSIRLQGDRAVFMESFSIAKLEAGDYLLEVYLYDGETLVADESRGFTIEWKDMKRVFGDLTTSIEMLQYLTTESEVAALQSIAEPESRINQFMEFWARRSDDPLSAIKTYYSLAFEASDKFSVISKTDTVPGWLTNQGRILCLYGQPSREEKGEEKNKKYLIWIYDSWGLRFVFDEDGNLCKPV